MHNRLHAVENSTVPCAERSLKCQEVLRTLIETELYWMYQGLVSAMFVLVLAAWNTCQAQVAQCARPRRKSLSALQSRSRSGRSRRPTVSCQHAAVRALARRGGFGGGGGHRLAWGLRVYGFRFGVGVGIEGFTVRLFVCVSHQPSWYACHDTFSPSLFPFKFLQLFLGASLAEARSKQGGPKRLRRALPYTQ